MARSRAVRASWSRTSASRVGAGGGFLLAEIGEGGAGGFDRSAQGGHVRHGGTRFTCAGQRSVGLGTIRFKPRQLLLHGGEPGRGCVGLGAQLLRRDPRPLHLAFRVGA